MAPLSTTAVAALDAALALKHGRFQLRLENRRMLREFWAGRGEGLTDLPWDVDKDDEATWEGQWRSIASDAGIDSASDVFTIIAWLRARCAPDKKAGKTHVVEKTLAALEANGVVVPATAIADLEKVIAEGVAGDTLAQCTCCKCVYILYLGRPPEPEDEEEWQRHKDAIVSTIDEAQVEITSFERYTKLHKNSTYDSMERALSSYAKFQLWHNKTVYKLKIQGMPEAAIRLSSLLTRAQMEFQNDEKMVLAYMRVYFFEAHQGVGMPCEYDTKSALRVITGGGLQKLKPATTSAYDLALAGADASEIAALGGSGVSSLSSVMRLPPSMPSGGVSSPSVASSAGPSASAVDADGVASLVRDMVLAEVSKIKGDPKGDTPKVLSIECRFCGKDVSECNLKCSGANEAFSLRRARINETIKNRKKKEDEEKKKEEE